MLEMTCSGTPVCEMSTFDIEDCLRHGIEITISDGIPNEEYHAIKRLELELYIRQNNLRAGI